MKKLTYRQIEALTWLIKEPWIAVWSIGSPHCGWPKQMSSTTFYALRERNFVSLRDSKRGPYRVVKITAEGLVALARALIGKD